MVLAHAPGYDVIWLGDTLLLTSEVKPVADTFPVQGTGSFPQRARSYFSKPCDEQRGESRPRVRCVVRWAWKTPDMIGRWTSSAALSLIVSLKDSVWQVYGKFFGSQMNAFGKDEET